MNKALFLAVIPFLLTACTTSTMSDADPLDNPLYAERYAERLVDVLVEMEIDNHPMLKDADVKKVVSTEKKHWLDIARDANKKQRTGFKGGMVETEQYATGEVLYTDEMVYFSTLFETDPGPSVHVYLTTVVDPRDVEFPDASAIDLGVLKTPYGAQAYAAKGITDPKLYRTVVLWDTKLKLVFGFAQMNPM